MLKQLSETLKADSFLVSINFFAVFTVCKVFLIHQFCDLLIPVTNLQSELLFFFSMLTFMEKWEIDYILAKMNLKSINSNSLTFPGNAKAPVLLAVSKWFDREPCLFPIFIPIQFHEIKLFFCQNATADEIITNATALWTKVAKKFVKTPVMVQHKYILT